MTPLLTTLRSLLGYRTRQQRHARVHIGRDGKRILTVLLLATKRAWAIDVSYLTPVVYHERLLR